MKIVEVSLVGLVLTFVAAAQLPLLAADPDDEAAVRALLQTWLEVSNRQDVDGILAHFAPDARIDSTTAGTKVSREMYAAALKVANARGALGRNIDAKIISLTFPTADRAVLELNTSWDAGPRGDRRTFKHRWTLRKREGRWLVQETEYLNR